MDIDIGMQLGNIDLQFLIHCGTLISLLVLDTIANLISSSSLPVDCLFISRGCTNTLSNILPIHMERSQVTSFFGANALWSKGYTGANVRT
ncbi:hypothetical protein QVD17_27883 [Tagetes erecta]|uniref:Uncharacterized protein n=1 Tax=Tagetes erecta TaxID=13708 RepID=A0AAD8KE25_TARER|nr:hypothetical protein QVD17_27883 [Tagetes erecta]